MAVATVATTVDSLSLLLRRPEQIEFDAAEVEIADDAAAAAGAAGGATAPSSSSSLMPLQISINKRRQPPPQQGSSAARRRAARQQQQQQQSQPQPASDGDVATTVTCSCTVSLAAPERVYRFLFEVDEAADMARFGLRYRYRRIMLLVGAALATAVAVDGVGAWRRSDPRADFAATARSYNVNVTDNERLPIDAVFTTYKHATGVQSTMQVVGAGFACAACLVEMYRSTAAKLGVSRVFVSVAFVLFSLAVVAVAWPDYVAAAGIDAIFRPCAPHFDEAVHWLFRTVVGMYFAVQVMARTLPVLMIFPPAAERIIFALIGHLYPDQPRFHTRLTQVVALVTPAMNAVPLFVICQFISSWAIKSCALVCLLCLPTLALLVEVLDTAKRWVRGLVVVGFVAGYWLPWILLLNQCAQENDRVRNYVQAALGSWQYWAAFIAEICLSTVALGDVMASVLGAARHDDDDDDDDDDENDACGTTAAAGGAAVVATE